LEPPRAGITAITRGNCIPGVVDVIW
jgi:hypothetical protein